MLGLVPGALKRSLSFLARHSARYSCILLHLAMTKTSSNLAAAAGSISAATAVFDNPDTRKQIWDFLDRADWVVLMRVSKEGLVESVRRVYRSMECDRVLKMNKANIDEVSLSRPFLMYLSGLPAPRPSR